MLVLKSGESRSGTWMIGCSRGQLFLFILIGIPGLSLIGSSCISLLGPKGLLIVVAFFLLVFTLISSGANP